MDTSILRYNSTKLKKISFDEEEFKGDLSYSFQASKMIIKTEENKDNLLVNGKINVKNNSGNVCFSIQMESMFNGNKLNEETLNMIDEDYLISPMYKEMRTILSYLSEHSFEKPIILPSLDIDE